MTRDDDGLAGTLAAGDSDPALDRTAAPSTGLDATHASDAPGGASAADTAPKIRAGRGAGAAPPDQLDKIGRFVVVGKLGEGGMGVVLAAYDPTLDRKVALKLVRAAGASHHQERLLREARAMARISHPNVLAVHDAGTYYDQVFIAMELVEGGTLRAWLAEPRPWRDVIARFLAAGRGLAAAHAAGLVHRDFKPDNVLLGESGTVRVADFGLVGAADTKAAPTADAAARPLGDHAMTAEGSIMGTPAYMAPEQHLGEAVGPAADQFAFCVALWEGLAGQRPFAGGTYEELAESVLQGRARLDGGRPFPAWLRPILERGIATDPAARWPSMEPLLDALADDPEARRKQRLFQGGAALGLTGLFAAVFVLRGGGDDPAARCGGAAGKFATVWTDARRTAVHDALVATGRGHATQVAARVADGIDAYGQAWSAARIDACEATHARGEQSAQLLDLKMACLDRHLVAVSSLLDVLAGPIDDDVLDQASRAVALLPAVADCADAAALQAAPRPSDPQARAAIEHVEAQLAQARALRLVGKYRQALPAAEAALAAAQPLGYAPVIADAHGEVGDDADELGEHDRALASYRAQVDAAATGRDAARVAMAWLRQVELLRGLARRDDLELTRLAARAAATLAAQPRVEAELAWVEAAVLLDETKYDEARAGFEAARRRFVELEGPDSRNAIVQQINLGVVDYHQGKYAEARAAFEAALAAQERVLGPDHPALAQLLEKLAQIRADAGDADGATAALDRAEALVVAARGPDHASVGSVLERRARILVARGDVDAGIAAFDRAIAILEKQLGPDHPDVATALFNTGDVLVQRGRVDEANARLERVLRIVTKAYGERHPKVALALRGLGVAASQAGKLDASDDYYRRALAIYEAIEGGEQGQAAEVVQLVANNAYQRGRKEEAIVQYRKALALLQAAYGAEHVEVARAIHNIGLSLQELGDLPGARAELERALAVREQLRGADSFDAAETRMALGDVLRAQGELDAAEPLLVAALATMEKVAPESVWKINALEYMAGLRRSQQRHGDAIDFHDRIVAARRALHGDADVQVAMAEHNRAAALERAQRFAAARDGFQRAVDVFLAVEPALRAYSYNGVAHAELELGRAAEALAAATKAKEALDAGLTPEQRTYNDYLLGRALYETGARGQGHALVTQAVAAFRRTDDTTLPEAEAWLKAHRR